MIDPENRTPPITPGRRRTLLLLITVSLATILLAVSAWWFFIGKWRTTTDDAYVGGDIVAVTPLTGGTVIAIHGDTTQAVAEGQLLVQLDDNDSRLQLDSAEAALASAVREVRGLYAANHGNLPLLAQRRADLARAQAELARSNATLAQAESEFKRREALARQNFISPENVQIAQTARDAAKAQYDAAASAVKAASATISQTQDQASISSALVDNTSLENHPNVRAAAARVREAMLALARTRVRAPVSGQIAKRTVQLGERVVPGAALMAIVPLDKVWLDANFKETELRDVRIGQPATLTSDFYGGATTFHGKVLGLTPGTGSAFALLPAQNATGNWVKIVQRLPVRIALDDKELQAHPLRIGLSMDVSIDTHDRSGPMLTTLPDARAIAATAVYAQDIKSADAHVAQIIADNLERK
ncbi:multidrug resistance protein [Ferrigenium kumadai]|uniref:Multidrug resistance protein n=1 Tax=Ferrigenium kumadai TaxID=1682490 RepID=A0AAN1SY33_9PROT|nr:efflux RND transporter periplasmic adaptor subunit [Ferrigenium kumadai]BBI99115.1 multidrug resistance protein [Ferrigenium kumadai]